MAPGRSWCTHRTIHDPNVCCGSWLRENSEIEFTNGTFLSTSINLENKSAGDGCRDKTIKKTILSALRARTFSRGLDQKLNSSSRANVFCLSLDNGHRGRGYVSLVPIGRCSFRPPKWVFCFKKRVEFLRANGAHRSGADKRQRFDHPPPWALTGRTRGSNQIATLATECLL